MKRVWPALVRMSKKFLFPFILFSLICLTASTPTAFAAIPLITDDTGTQGKGKFQLEVLGEYGYEKEEGVKENTEDLT
ncbi:MAG: hypothetical protein RBR16_11745, partial [Syntrophus sp. (in: bacteria)]|nr:hypothetical protein [Syntrophus sp. (in: bacteria)]